MQKKVRIMDTIVNKKYSLTDFFNAHWENYVKEPSKPIKPEHFKAVNAIRTCHTEVLGKRIYVCPDCGDVSESFHSCKHRFCPNCSWNDTIKWAEKAYQKLINIPHIHAVATLPHALNPLLKRNYRLLNNALLRASADTIKDWQHAKYAVTPGIMSILHTFGEKKNQHNHAHMIVSMGGINKKIKQLKIIADNFIPYKFLSNKFKIKFEDILVKHFDNNELVHNLTSKTDLLILLKKINKDNWRFHFEKPMTDPLKIIKYIGRYSKRACLSESKITDISGEYISFKYKDYKDKDANNNAKEKILKLQYKDFFPRLLQHVPPTGFQIIRYYGLYSNSNKIDKKHTLKPETEKQACTSYQNPKYCKYCGIEKIHYYTVFDRREPKKRTDKFDINKHESTIVYIQKIA